MHFLTLFLFSSSFVFFHKGESDPYVTLPLFSQWKPVFLALSYSMWCVYFNALREILISMVGVAYTSVLRGGKCMQFFSMFGFLKNGT